ncbi:glutamate synthase subunit beta [Bifidobacterium sp. ESL0798]|uniref:glutamate synthase subunit beta n=1 Tax=Bifidobacterium sp. ESL0798 TaxID=2983235 RepID=UPI0023F8053D|nr:glutamate synthase subunit beta [Bifidobacterium sp. ESL0798]WEV74746.1 glutamate synthase subunit beta [Bifidobacterium sp. ESL0798]
MSDPRGFLKVRTRHEAQDRPVAERIRDWKDVHAQSGFQPWTKEQAARCMDCGTPFCMTGCPLGNIIPDFNDLVRQGQWEEAYQRLSSTNNFPEVTGLICPAPCEQACVLGIHQPPTMIKADEQAIIDQAWKLDYVKPMPPQRLTDMTIAIVGSGPAGLACAQQLTRAGHTVVVYERDDEIGGLMRYGIPSFKLDKHLIDRRIEQMEAEGTVFRTNMEIGKDLSWDELRSRYDAVVVAIGSGVPRDVNVPGRELDGIHFAMDFLPDANRRVEGKKPVNDIDAAGKRVVIIGGGDTGSDCLGTAIRQGATSITVLQINPKEPSVRPDNQPWPTYARLYQPTTSMEEGGTYEYNTDTVSFTGVEEVAATERVTLDDTGLASGFVADESGHVTGVKVIDVERTADGKRQHIAGTERVIDADLVLISTGFLHPDTSTILDQLPVDLDRRGNLARNKQFETSQDGVFVCGDAGRGQSLVVWAIAEGRSCASAVDRFLNGTTELPAPIVSTQKPMALPKI